MAPLPPWMSSLAVAHKPLYQEHLRFPPTWQSDAFALRFGHATNTRSLTFLAEARLLTRAQAALLLCGLDPQHCEMSNEGQLMGAQAQKLNGDKLQVFDEIILPP